MSVSIAKQFILFLSPGYDSSNGATTLKKECSPTEVDSTRVFSEAMELLDGGTNEFPDNTSHRIRSAQLARCIDHLQPRQVVRDHLVCDNHSKSVVKLAESAITSTIGQVFGNESVKVLALRLIPYMTYLLTEAAEAHVSQPDMRSISMYLTQSLLNECLSADDLNMSLSCISRLVKHILSPAWEREGALQLLYTLSVIPSLSPYIALEIVDEITAFLSCFHESLALTTSRTQATLIVVNQACQMTKLRHLMNVVEVALATPLTTDIGNVHKKLQQRFSVLVSVPLDGTITQYAPLLCASVWRLVSVACETIGPTASQMLVKHLCAVRTSQTR